MNDVAEVLNQFFAEFQQRLDELVKSRHDDKVKKDILYLLVENLILKYENKIHQNKQGLFSRLMPFMQSSSYDVEFEERINQKLEQIVRSRYYKSGNGTFNRSIKNSFRQVSEQSNLPVEYRDPQLDNFTDNIDKGFSKTNIPGNIEIALELQPLKGKNQDHVDYFVTRDGMPGIVLCDGVSGDGKHSQNLAQMLPKLIGEYLTHNFHSDLLLDDWKLMVTDAIKFGLEEYEEKSGASTVLIQVVDSRTDQIFIAYMGDGNILHFNPSYTGFSKLLNPHQNNRGNLTRVVTAEGLVGGPEVQILSGNGGSLIVSSDGFNLSNGRILKHFFNVVLKAVDLREGLHIWADGCCENPKLHPVASDDRSIGIIRWSNE